MTHPNRARLSKLSLALIAALAAAPVFAQNTSAAVGGRVVSADGQPVAGAEVTITHVESGTVSKVITDADGRYSARGLRVGGPYTVVVNKAGAGTDSEQNVYLQLAPNTVNLNLAQTLETVTVVGTAEQSVFSPDKMGAGTAIGQATIEALPSAGGNIQDYMRLDPRVTFINRAEGSISAGGQNPRFNNIRVDGVSASDTFGLEGNGMTTRRQPVAMEAIEAINVDLSNYDVSISGATGAVVDAVTKSGTNEFHGSLYGKYRDGDWFGKDPLDRKFNGFTKETDYGVTFGGPLLKDRLFFFLNYDKYEQAAPGADLSSGPYSRIGQTNIDRAVADARNYGIDAGTLDSNTDTSLEEYALKLDWNISDAHRASLRYSHLDQSKLRLNGFNSSQMSLSSYWFQHDKSVESYVGQLFSDWTDNLSTELKVSYRDYSAIRSTPADKPSVRINFGSDALFLGTETNSQANELYTKTWNAYGAANWYLGDHELKFGFDWSSNEIYNIFAPNIYGVYVFSNLANFETGTWQNYNLRTPQPGQPISSMAADYTYRSLGLFVQDQWTVNDALTLTFGLRGDRPTVDHDPQYNPLAQAAFGYDNSDVGLGKILWQPRLGFNYNFAGDRRMQLRGGVGLFMGDAPQVWISNSYNTTGLNYINYSFSAFNPALRFNGAPIVPTTPGSSTQNVSFTSPDFEQPSVWKANLAFDTDTGWLDTVFTTELLLTQVKSALFYRNLNLGRPSVIGPDGRAIFYNPAQVGRAWNTSDRRFFRDRRFDQVYLIDTTDQGQSQQLTVSLTKPWSNDSDWSWMLGYTYTHATEVSGLTSSTVTSNWANNYAFNANEERAGRARYEIRDRISGQLTWKHDFFGDYRTQVGLVYEGRSGRPYSYVYFNDANGDEAGSSGTSLNDLFYVPARPGDVLFGNLSSTGVFTADPNMEAAFFQWAGTQNNLMKYAGRVVPQNSARSAWVNTFDLRLSQELPGFFKGHKSELWFDIQNVGNLLNKKWGEVMDYGFFADARVATLQGIYNGKYVYNFRTPDQPTVANGDADGFNQGISQWSLQVGFKYQF
jgi:hypothetical protein